MSLRAALYSSSASEHKVKIQDRSHPKGTENGISLCHTLMQSTSTESGNLEYLRHFATHTAYIPPWEHSESCLVYKRRIHNTMHFLLIAITETPELRIARPWPNTDWETVWQKVHETPVSMT